MFSGFDDDFVYLAIDRDCDIKVSCFEKSEHGAESEAYIQLFILLFSITTAEPFRRQAGVKARDMYGKLVCFHRGDACTLTGAEAAELPSVSPDEKNRCQNKRNYQQCAHRFFSAFIVLILSYSLFCYINRSVLMLF